MTKVRLMLVRALLNNQKLSRTECQKEEPLDTEVYSGNVV